ncbi:MAG TPA: ABC transporter permease, partial [Caulifigura sp.]|nr:ABC transporter permease [Caulifigura sp.]
MLTKALALLSQTFRVDVRQLRTHLLRGGVAAGVLWMLAIIHMENRFRGSPGLEFCAGLAMSTMVMMTLMGAFYFPSVITEEKEEQTLGLLRMAGVNSVTLLLGKSVARVGVILLLIAVTLPYWLLSVTLGGVTSTQVAAIAVCLAAHLALMSQIGTLCSVYFTTTGRACVAAAIILFLIMVAPAIAQEIL